MTRVLVSGAAGFIGLPVVGQLVRHGADVHAISRRPAPQETLGAHWHQADLADDAAVDELMNELAPEQLVHLAWYTNHGRFWQAPENLDWIGHSLRLLRAFVHHGGRRLVMLGSCAEYDWLTADRPLSEARTRLAPSTLYGVAKDALRRVAAAYAEQEQVELAWARPFFLYGPGESSARLVPSVIRSLLADEIMEVSAGGQVRDFTYVEDIAGAVVALLESHVVGDVNIASGTGVRVGEVIELIAQMIGSSAPLHSGRPSGRPGEPSSLVADIARLRDEVGYRQRWTLAAGLEATIRWWETDGGRSGTAPRIHPATHGQRIAKADAAIDRLRRR